jgi:ribosomal protein S18 acetylase RimI-like enzyme
VLFATATLAARVERAECRMASDFAECARRRRDDVLVEPIGGAAAVFAGPGAPCNKLAGLGFGVPIDENALSAIEGAFDARESPIRVELSAMADPAVASTLGQRGYGLVGFENVLGLGLTEAVIDGLASAVDADRSGGVTTTAASSDQLPTWIHVVTTGFAHPDVFDGPAADESYERETLAQIFGDFTRIAGLAAFLARREDEPAGGGAMRIVDGIAQLCGAATLPEHRRRGVQSALLRFRLLSAARNGCQLAVVTTQPGSKSQENVQRAGFELLYARAILVRPVGGRH